MIAALQVARYRKYLFATKWYKTGKYFRRSLLPLTGGNNLFGRRYSKFITNGRSKCLLSFIGRRAQKSPKPTTPSGRNDSTFSHTSLRACFSHLIISWE